MESKRKTKNKSWLIVIGSLIFFTGIGLISYDYLSNKKIDDQETTMLEEFYEVEEEIESIEEPQEIEEVKEQVKVNYIAVLKIPMPRLGGLAIFLSFLIGYMFFAPLTTQMISILIGSFLIILLGIIDDINPLKATTKLWGQILVAIILVFFGNIYINELSLFGMEINLGIWAYPLSLFIIVACINSINLIDGLDGLAAGTSSIYFLTIIIISILLGRIDNLGFILCLLTLGATLGFLCYNFNPASIFMGDTGSMFLGFMVSVVSLLGFKTATLTSFLIPILILFIPILDTLLAILRRLIKGESIGKPDKEHVHFQLLNKTSSVKKTVLIIYLINALFSAVSVLYAVGLSDIAIVLYLLLMVIVIIFIFKTDILYKHDSKKHKKIK